MPCVLRDLERVTGLVGRQIGNQDKGLTVTLNLVIDVNSVCLHDWHGDPSSLQRQPSAPAAEPILP